MLLDLSISPDNPLYAGLGVEVVGGRANLPDAMSADVLNAIGAVVKGMVDAETDRTEVVLTGPCAVQVYMVVLHVVLHVFNRVVYRDGRGNTCIIAAHG